MKKIFFSVLALGLAFSSCSNVEDEGVSNGAKQTVNFELSAPEAFAEGTRAGDYVNSAKGGVTNLAGETITYHLAFYYGGNLEWSGTQTSTATSVKFQPELIIGENYKLVAYATFGGEQADLTNIAVSSGINNEANDAYSCTKDVEASLTMSATLTRPSAKLRFLAKDYETGKAHGFNITKVSVEYTNNYAETFNAYEGLYGAAGTTKTSEAAAVEYTQTENTVFTDYVPVNADVDETVKVVVTYTDGGVEKAREFDFTPVPLKRNYLTTIKANVWKEQAEVEVIIDEAFENEDNKYVVSSAEEFKEALAYIENSDPAEAKIIIKGDATTWETGGGHGSTPLLEKASTVLTIQGENTDGSTVLTATGAGVGALRSDKGKLIFKDLTIVDKSVSYNESAWELTYLEFSGALEFDNVTFKGGIIISDSNKQVPDGSAIFNKCTFITEEASVYGAWVDNGSATFTECAFQGTRGLKMHEAYGSDVDEVIVDNCTFGPLSKKPGIAIGTIDATTVVTVKNSTFIGCQAGDQGKYIYETDTDVTTFQFTEENNKVASAVVSSNADMATAIANGDNTVFLAPGSYVIPSAAKGKTLNIIGTGNPEDVTVAVTKVGTGGENCDYGLDGSTVTFEGVTIATNSSTYIGYARCNGTYKNCIINGTYTLYGNSTFEKCTFNVSGDVYNIWTWGAPTATFTECTFNSDGKALLLYGTANTKLTVNGCTFNDKGGLTDLKAAIEIGNDYNKSYELIVNNTIVNGYEINDKGINTGTTLWANKNSMPQDKLNVVVDGVDVY
ncbi:MAG: right-handed parallel beta-helix repeat-containing protein [Prevotella sp.]|nr:right-handed parallel beta-helix repeat-containing protein [Prevotella sp.]